LGKSTLQLWWEITCAEGTSKLWGKVHWGWCFWNLLGFLWLNLLLGDWWRVIWSVFLGLGNSLLLLFFLSCLLIISLLFGGFTSLDLGILFFLSLVKDSLNLLLLLLDFLGLLAVINWTKLFIFILLESHLILRNSTIVPCLVVLSLLICVDEESLLKLLLSSLH